MKVSEMFCFETKAALRKKNTILQAKVYELEEVVRHRDTQIKDLNDTAIILGGKGKKITLAQATQLLDRFAELVHMRFQRRY